MAVLTWETSTGRQRLELGDVAVLGRVAECDVVLPAPEVSRQHARIRRDAARWLFEDEGSHNGSYINGTLSTATTALADGDIIHVGAFRLTFNTGATSPLPSPPLAGNGDQAASLSALASLDLSRLHAPMAAGNSVDISRRLQATYEIARATTGTFDESEMLEQVLAVLFDIFEAADRGMILLGDGGADEIRRGAVKQRTGDDRDAIELSDTALERAFKNREALLCRDTGDDGHFSAAQSIVDLGIRSIMIAPLVYRDQVYGAIYLDAIRRAAGFSSADLKLLGIAAADVAAALAHAELHRHVVQNERMAAMGETATGLSHCIKNILQGVKTGSYVVDQGLEMQDLGMIDTGWQVIKRKNDFMEKLVWDLLTLSKPREAEFAPTDLNALCEEMCDVGAHDESGNDVSVIFKADPDLPAVMLDAKGFRRCLLNLVTNAMDACSKAGGEVRVETDGGTGDDPICVTIHDNGCGMSDATQAKLFTMFFSTKGAKGTGLGLPVTKKIIEEHGGQLDVSSIEGRGTTFTISLPIEHKA
ncbi:MAG: FHA domain-containing protein [Verrucomicrobia bacterium]|jgi:two-component system, NtrC family, sensor kinase|nr:FHA domain-containing protein [Verrucomicrobiota bacterium]MBT7066308.1 FHA domain-containing protein [Verrucomicrobiota bacterium]MBT7699266.1 FHA domain-containing protein [Verrucomicrobiota bacterium]